MSNTNAMRRNTTRHHTCTHPARLQRGSGPIPDTLRALGGLAFASAWPRWPAAHLTAPTLAEPTYLWYATDADCQPVPSGGATWQDADARHLMLWGIDGGHGTRVDQTHNALAQLEAELSASGFALTDVIRTWYFLDDILDWYDDFNAIRNDLFHSRGVFDALMPASTGIGCGTASGSVVCLSAWARRPTSAGAPATALASPLQCPAFDYRSAFSRGIAVPFRDGTHLSISGTASIGSDGSTLHADDFEAQVAHTLAVAEAILDAAGASWREVVGPIAYLRRREDHVSWQGLRATRPDLANLDWIDVQATVCRDDLLFEIECDAWLVS